MTSGCPAISVVMTVYNEPPSFLIQALDSMITQSYDDFELLIIDDGSSNKDTLAALNEYQERDSRIRLYLEPNRGQTPSLNLGLERAQGELIFRHDSDDWSEPDRFRKQIEFLDKHPHIGLVGCNIMRHTSRGDTLWCTSFPIEAEAVLLSFPQLNPLAHGSVCFRKSCTTELGGYREFFKYAQDYDLFWRIAERYGAANIPEPLYHLRHHCSSISAQNTLGQTRELMIIRELAQMRATSSTDDIEAATKEVDARLPSSQTEYFPLLRIGDYQMLAGEHQLAFSSYLQALRHRPLGVKILSRLLRYFLYLLLPPFRKQMFEPNLGFLTSFRKWLSLP